ncbi:MAG: response regulator transcription factor [Clostridia bacterium]|nr:response regulator transcription factor [Clostridia bacterium]
MIYLLEDDASIRNFVEYALKNSGFDVKGFEKPSEFWRTIEGKELPSLLLLDIMLPEEDGIEVLKKLRVRSDTKDLPVILLTAKTTEYDKVLGLDSGADDYIPKPFGVMELIARIKALLRRSSPVKKEKEYVLQGLCVCPEKHTVRANGKDIVLTLKEFELLCLLISNPGIVFTRDRILQQIWGYSFDGENRTVDVHVRTLRQKLCECGDLIETVRGIGYKMGG